MYDQNVSGIATVCFEVSPKCIVTTYSIWLQLLVNYNGEINGRDLNAASESEILTFNTKIFT